MPTDLATSILARLDALEAVAKAATPGAWKEDKRAETWRICSGKNETIALAMRIKFGDTRLHHPEDARANRRHIATFGPPTALAFCRVARGFVSFASELMTNDEIPRLKAVGERLIAQIADDLHIGEIKDE